MHDGIRDVGRSQVVQHGLCPARITDAGQHKDGESLGVTAVRSDLEHSIRSLASFLDIAVHTLPQRGNSLPDCCGFVELRILRDLDGPARQLARLLDMSRIRFRVGLQSQHGIFPAWFAGGPGHLPLHCCGLAAQEGQRVEISVHRGIIELAGKGLVQDVLCFFQALQGDIGGRKVLVPGSAAGVEAERLLSEGGGLIVVSD